MNVKEVVSIAVNHIQELYELEEISNFGLEEIEFDQHIGEWLVTVGFSRPWDNPRNSEDIATETATPKRTFKIIQINESGEVVSIKNREDLS